MRKTGLTLLIISLLLIVGCGDGQNGNILSGIDDTVVSDGDGITDSTTHEKKTSVQMPRDVQRWPIISTGQTRCYNNYEEISCPEPGERFYGQDASHSVGLRSFVDDSDATVKDLTTGYIWQQKYAKNMTWFEAKAYCEGLSLEGYEWRLPTVQELSSILDYGVKNPAVDTDVFPDDDPDSHDLSNYFWASEHQQYHDPATGEDAAWIVYFYDGFREYTAKTNEYYVRCIKVR